MYQVVNILCNELTLLHAHRDSFWQQVLYLAAVFYTVVRCLQKQDDVGHIEPGELPPCCLVGGKMKLMDC